MMVPPLPKLDMKVFDLRRRDLSLLGESVMACSGTVAGEYCLSTATLCDGRSWSHLMFKIPFSSARLD